MRLIEAWAWARSIKFTVAEAVDAALYENDCSDRADNAQASANKCREYLARLTQALHDNGALSNNDVLLLLPGFKEDIE